MELWDKDPGGLAGDLGQRLREAGKERGKELLTCGSGPSGNAGSRGRAAERRRRAVRSVGADRWACGSGADGPLRDAGERGQASAGKECGVRLGREKNGPGGWVAVGLGLVGLLGLDSFSNFFPLSISTSNKV